MSNRKRIGALIMALALCMTMLPSGVWASEEPAEDAVTETVSDAEPAAPEEPEEPEESETPEDITAPEETVEPDASEEPAENEEPSLVENSAVAEEAEQTEETEAVEETEQEDAIDPTAIDWPDSGEMFSAHAERVLYGETDRLGGSSLDGYERLIGEDFEGIQLEIYRKMKGFVRSVANGETTSTILVVEPESDTDGFDTDSFRAVFRALLSDCPYDLYWLDKTVGVTRSTTKRDGKVVKYTFRFCVSSDYWDDSADEPKYAVNSARAVAASATADKAKSIVELGAGLSDYERLAYYCDAICDLASYNYDAAQSGSGVYGDPWQLIYVFDGDETTKTVCEGYAKAFQYLCDLTTFENNETVTCITVTGTTSGTHMWNIVTMDDGEHYLVDVTNCDTMGGRAMFLRGGGNGSVSGGYSVAYGSQTIRYVYDSMTTSVFPADELKLAAQDYGTHQRLSLSAAEVTVADGELVYNGNAQEPAVTVRLNGNTLQEDVDYEVEYSANINAGSGYVKVTGIGDYSGSTGSVFTIGAKSIRGAVVTVSDQIYTGKARKPAVRVVLDGKELAEGTDYTLIYANNTKIGAAYVTATGRGNYTGSVRGDFSIWAAEPELTVSSAATSVKISWNAVTGAQKYRVLRKAKGQTSWTTLADTGDTAYQDILPESGVTYTYLVRCISADGKSYISAGNQTGKTITYKNVLPTTSGWAKYDGQQYYIGSDGKPVVSRWLKTGGAWYYFEPDGVMLASTKRTISGSDYIFKSSGAMATGWVKLNGNWYYCNTSGTVKKSAWLKSSGSWYYLRADGRMATGRKMTISGSDYIFKSSGVMATGWAKLDGSWYYCNTSGTVKKSSWLKSGGSWYYLCADGKMAAGRKMTISGSDYIFKSSGVMATGWAKLDGNWYYCNASGTVKKSSWLKLNGVWYYLKSDGVMAASETLTIKGTRYTFNSSGRWVS